MPKAKIKAKSKLYFRKRLSGVTRIIRDGYGDFADWKALTRDIKKRDGYKCVFCGRPEQPKQGIFHDVHHIKRLADGGTNAPANLATTCDSCHERRPGHSHMKGKASPGQVLTRVKSGLTYAEVREPVASKFSAWRSSR